MFKRFYPYEYVESVFTIDYEKLYQKGFRGIMFDIDNTLVPHGENSTIEIDSLFKKIHLIGFKTLMLSNNGKERIERFLKNIDSEYIDNSEKPRKKNYIEGIKKMGLKKEEVLFVGDQVFTDILGANRAKIPSILVKYIGYYDKGPKGKRRDLESFILKLYSKNQKMQNRLGNIEIKGED